MENSNGTLTTKKVTWDCVQFGSYPQSEVTSSNPVYQTLLKASGWNGNEITLNGTRYRRINGKDATVTTTSNSYFDYYNWDDYNKYHYFKYEPIKWRVLKTDGKQALLLSDIALDDQAYNSRVESITWEYSSVRSWLNGYGASFNRPGIDYSKKNFIGTAFTASEQSAIKNTSVTNANNIQLGTPGGNPTTDRIFLLSQTEAYSMDPSANNYDTNTKVYLCKSSTYAKAMGTIIGKSGAYEGNCWWWLRSPGMGSDAAMYVDIQGLIQKYGHAVNLLDIGIRAALNLNLSSDQWKYAGTVSSAEIADSGSGNGTAPKITLSGISKKIAAGKKIMLTVNGIPSMTPNNAVTWKSSNTRVATVDSSGVVTIKKKTGGKKVTISATAKDGSGSKATYTISVMKESVKKVSVSGKKTVKAGKSLSLKAKVTAPKGANKKLKWYSSDPKFAKVNSNGVVKTYKKGKGKTVNIICMSTDGSGKHASIRIKLL